MARNRNRNRQRQNRPAGTEARAAAGAPRPFTFTHGDERYTLPPAAAAPSRMEAGALIDAVTDTSGVGELRLGIAMLHAAGPDPAALKALRAMSIEEFGRVIGRWMRQTGAAPGESPGSST